MLSTKDSSTILQKQSVSLNINIPETPPSQEEKSSNCSLPTKSYSPELTPNNISLNETKSTLTTNVPLHIAQTSHTSPKNSTHEQEMTKNSTQSVELHSTQSTTKTSFFELSRQLKAYDLNLFDKITEYKQFKTLCLAAFEQKSFLPNASQNSRFLSLSNKNKSMKSLFNSRGTSLQPHAQQTQYDVDFWVQKNEKHILTLENLLYQYRNIQQQLDISLEQEKDKSIVQSLEKQRIRSRVIIGDYTQSFKDLSRFCSDICTKMKQAYLLYNSKNGSNIMDDDTYCIPISDDEDNNTNLGKKKSENDEKNENISLLSQQFHFGLQRSLKSITSTLDTALNAQESMQRQKSILLSLRERMGGLSQGILPSIHTTLSSIDYYQFRNTLILGTLIAICLFIFIIK